MGKSLHGRLYTKNGSKVNGEYYMLGIHQRIKDFYPEVKRLAETIEAKGDAIEEIVLQEANRTSKIVGYYDWNGTKLVKDKAKDAWLHNILYGKISFGRKYK